MTTLKRAIPNIPGKNLVALVVNYPPGGKSPPHRHAKSAFIYAHVLTGAASFTARAREVPFFAFPVQSEHLRRANEIASRQY